MLAALIPLLLIVALLTWAIIYSRAKLKRFARLASTRDPAAVRASYAVALADVPPQTRADVYALVQRVLPLRNFPVAANDDLWVLYKLDARVIEFELEKYFKVRGIKLDRVEPVRRQNTVADLVRWVERHCAERRPS